MSKIITLDLKKSEFRMSERQKRGLRMSPRGETLYFLMQFARNVQPMGGVLNGNCLVNN